MKKHMLMDMLCGLRLAQCGVANALPLQRVYLRICWSFARGSLRTSLVFGGFLTASTRAQGKSWGCLARCLDRCMRLKWRPVSFGGPFLDRLGPFAPPVGTQGTLNQTALFD